MHRITFGNSADAERRRAVETGHSVSSSRPQSARRPTGPRTSANPYNRIEPSPFRPRVLAKDRIRTWRTPYTFHSLRSLSSSFSPELISRWKSVLSASVDEATHGSYGAGLLRFNHFCDLNHIPENERMPASEALLSMFIASYGAGHVASGTVSTWLAGLQLWHAVNFAPWLGDTLLSRTKKGVSKMAPSSSRRPPRDPVSHNHMTALRASLDLSNTRDSAIWAVACAAWADCARLGEVLIDSPAKFDPARNVTRGCPKKRGLASNGHKSFGFKVPWTKTRGSEGDWLTSTEAFGDVDAVSALEHHLFVNGTVPDSAPLFAYTTTSGWAHLTRSDFLACCNDIWVAAGMGALYGHGFRIGGTTHLLLHGVDPWVVMKQGRWTSAAFLLYWRNIEEILPLFIGDALDSFASIKESVSRLANSL
ncbi:DNA breaking-rejoining enzyme [Mycena metata]|uniref:DNA breaking-rejoining enzyme n=1 Tax=Mycena metata TaxID=1033252 RepID=A0AAD7HBP4_9AGAR|nr:DNA breaking-rejoining enzyme [Mycena metata]